MISFPGPEPRGSSSMAPMPARLTRLLLIGEAPAVQAEFLGQSAYDAGPQCHSDS